MDAINLIHRYNEGRIDIDSTGIFTCIDEEDAEYPVRFAKWMFGSDVVIRGQLTLGATYIYAYSQNCEKPSGFTADDKPSMVILDGDGELIFVYEIEDV